ncbi:MAG: 7-cyano-7-deazaguanine synthase QueC [Chloroflexi bacterium]|nr:7-cyano-7-deazaguanine synthase QueC [Chloroflexota bacterium]
MTDSVAIISGGMDSVTLLYHLVKVGKVRPLVITFAYGQKHNKEVAFAQIQASLLDCIEHLVLDISFLSPLFASSALVSNKLQIPNMTQALGDPQPLTYVPNRNMIFLALAAAYAETQGVTDVYYGAQRHDMYGYWDTTSDFLQRLNDVFTLNRKTPIQIKAPFVNYSKTDILRLGLELGVDYSQTWSCYEGKEVACGQCPTCAERLQAFANLGMIDPVLYAKIS